MQIYGLRLFNFLRYGEVNNSVVFDVTEVQKRKINNNELTLDRMFEGMKGNPVKYIDKVKDNGLSGILGIAGSIAGNEDRSNGVGKSAILEGICYALFGKIVRKNVNTDKIEAAGKSVVTRINGKYPENLKESYVEIIFEEQGKIYRLKRGRSFSKSKKSSQPILEFECYNADEVDSQTSHRTGDTDDAVAKVVNMDYDVFVNSVMFGQSDAGKFLTGTDKTRKEMLVSLLHLENVVTGCLENVRDRKSKKNKEIEATQGKVEAMEKIIKGSLPDAPLTPQVVLDVQNCSLEELVEKGLKLLEADIEECKKGIAETEKESKKLDKDIATLANSEVLTKIETIKAEGRQVKEDKTSKTEQMEAQAKQWKDLYATALAQHKKSTDGLTQLNAKEKNLIELIADKKKTIESFDKEECDKGLAKVKKAIEAKPKYSEGIAKLREQSDKLMAEQSKFSERESLHYDTHAILASQLKEGEDSFKCESCHSKVTREHIEKEVKEALRKRDEAKKVADGKFKERQEITQKIDEASKKLDKINEIVATEATINASIKEHEGNKKRLAEMEADKEQCLKAIESNKEEIEKSQKQQEECKEKASEIKKQFSDDIDKLATRLLQLGAELKHAEEAAKDVQGKIKTMEAERKDLTSQKATFNAKIGSTENRIKDIKERVEETVQLQKDLEEQQKGLVRLLSLEGVFGLDGIQTRIVQKYLPLLNVYIKEFLDILSDGEMLVEMVINDKGKVDIIISGGQADTFPMLSGGEKMIVRLAVDIGLALLSFSRCSQKPEMICLDEIFGPLDNSHTEAVFRLLATLRDKFSRVLVISHKIEINNLIINKIMIEKGAGSLGLSEIRKIV